MEYGRPKAGEEQRPAKEREAAVRDSGPDRCRSCGAALTNDDRGLTRKLVNRNTTSFYCKKCLAEKFRMTVEDCDTLIEHYRADGCSMFL